MSVRTREFSALTWPEVAAAMERDAGVLIPIGSTEQHGHHLSVATDALLATDLAHAIAADESQDLLVAPAVTYGYRSRPLSGGGPGFVGTTSASAATLIALVQDVLESLLEQGFRRLALVNDVLPVPDAFVPKSGSLWKSRHGTRRAPEADALEAAGKDRHARAVVRGSR